MKNGTLFLIGLFLFPLAAWSSPPEPAFCHGKPIEETQTPREEGAYLVYNCFGSKGLLEKEVSFLASTVGAIGRWRDYSQGKLVRERIWNSFGELMAFHTFEFISKDTFYMSGHNLQTGEVVSKVLQKHVPQKDGSFSRLLLQEWTFKNGRTIHSDEFYPDTRVAKRRFVYDDTGKVQLEVRYRYPKSERITNRLAAFDVYDSKGQQIRHYDNNRTCDPVQVLESIEPNSAKRKELRRQLLDASREPVVLIDSGYDVWNKKLTALFYPMYKEGFAWMDGEKIPTGPIFGWHVDRVNHCLNEVAAVEPRGVPFSHGSHVASVALDGVEKTAGIIAFAGDRSSVPLHKKAQDVIRKYKVRFVNMSFGWDMSESSFGTETAGTLSLETLIRESTETVFVVAAGNSLGEIKLDGSCQVPVCFGTRRDLRNMLRVGALDIATADEKLMVNAKVAYFSSYSSTIVDVFAPGDDVMGAALGGGMVAASGSSMASPYTMNLLLKMSAIAREMPAMKLREILLKTVYIRDLQNLLPARSGGMIFPRRALEVVRLLKANPHLSVEDAVWRVRENPDFLLAGESNMAQDKVTLESIWKNLDPK